MEAGLKSAFGALATVVLSLLGVSLLLYIPYITESLGQALAIAGAAMLIALAPLPLLRLKLSAVQLVQFIWTEVMLLALAGGMGLIAYLRLKSRISEPLTIAILVICLSGVVAVIEFGFRPRKREDRLYKTQATDAKQFTTEGPLQRKLYSHPWQADPRCRFTFLIFPLVAFLISKGDISFTGIVLIISMPLSFGYWWAFRKRAKWIAIDAEGISAESYDHISQHTKWSEIERLDKHAANLIWGRTEIWIYSKGICRPIIATGDMSDSRELFDALETRRPQVPQG